MRKLSAGAIVLALVLAACSGSSLPLGRLAAPQAVVVWPALPLPTEPVRAVRRLPGVVGMARIGSGVLDLVRVHGADRPLPRRAARAILPVSVLAFDPAAFRRVGAMPEVGAALARGEAVLTSGEAALRGMDAGDALRLDGDAGSAWFRVGAVIPEDDLFDAEAILPLARARALGVPANRAMVLLVRGDRVEAVASAIPAALGGAAARLGPLGPWRPRGTTSILSLARIKQTFGEFTFQRRDGYFFHIDDAWEDAHIAQESLPVLGVVKCHRMILPQLAGAMRELAAKGLAPLVRSVDGCWSPRMQFGNRKAISRHSFGIAIDLNYATNRYGQPPAQDARLVEIMGRWGFVWGGRWMIPDGMHFEFVRFVA